MHRILTVRGSGSMGPISRSSTFTAVALAVWLGWPTGEASASTTTRIYRGRIRSFGLIPKSPARSNPAVSVRASVTTALDADACAGLSWLGRALTRRPSR